VKINPFAGRFAHPESSPIHGNNCALHMNNRTERHEEFVVEYVRNGGNATQAAIFCSVSGSSASTVCYRLKNRVMDEIEIEQREALKGYAPKALHQIQTQAETAVNKNANLNANCDLLDRAGWNPVEKSEVTEISDLQNMINEELQAELDALYKADAKRYRGYMNMW